MILKGCFKFVTLWQFLMPPDVLCLMGQGLEIFEGWFLNSISFFWSHYRFPETNSNFADYSWDIWIWKRLLQSWSEGVKLETFAMLFDSEVHSNTSNWTRKSSLVQKSNTHKSCDTVPLKREPSIVIPLSYLDLAVLTIPFSRIPM